MAKRCLFRPLPEQRKVESLASAIGTSPLITSLLVQKGITTFEQAKAYFRPSLDALNDPFMMKDMDKAVHLLMHAIEKGRAILIYGDYDVDGVTAVTMVYDFLKNLYPRIDFYVPDRHIEGYGISMQAIEWAAKHGFDLIISLDCGIRAITCVQRARELGIDVIVCDHHEPGDTLPEAYAVLNPKQQDCAYPFKELSGCGIGFKLLQAFTLQKKLAQKSLYPYLDLVAVSIAADIVPIVGENRILAYHGLQQLNTKPRPGLKALIEVGNVRSPLRVSEVVFGIAPRINAAGRVAHASIATQLLLAVDQETAEALAHQVNQKNTYRRDVDSSTTEEALAMIESDTRLVNAKTTVLFKHDWHKGVVGIVAARCIERYYRPTVILTASNNKATGSVRSVVGYDVYKAISACAHLLDQYGGHQYAAGLTLPLDNVPAFQQRFEEVVANSISEELLIRPQVIDLPLTLGAINFKCYNILKQMAPFGPGNMKPTFFTENVIAKSYSILKEKHLKLFIYQKDASYKLLEAIGFGLADYAPLVREEKPFNIVYTIEENHYLGEKSLQLNIKDIQARKL
ncbi:MAG: single-stranded-DNA-specific exonuclease RecJ [Cytophagales bacterium]|nr:single-stranded-DNA-specific exonuclease RecJ [Cytophagales bacterium]